MIAGRTAMAPGLKCPATFVEGRFGSTNGNTYVIREIWEIRLVAGATPACADLRAGKIAFDPAAPLVRLPTDHTHHQTSASEGVGIVVVVVVVLVAIVLLTPFKIGPLHPSPPQP